MKTEYEILSKTDITDDISVIVVKKVCSHKCCNDCPNLKYFGDLSLHYCNKYKNIVEPTDICIEVGM